MKHIDKKELKTLIAPILATFFIFLNLAFGVELPPEAQSEILLGVTNTILIVIVLYGIWHNHDKRKE